MTPLELPAFMAGTVAGMTVWGVVYASLGGASRSLLKSGMDTEQLFGGQCLHSLSSSCTALHCIATAAHPQQMLAVSVYMHLLIVACCLQCPTAKQSCERDLSQLHVVC